MSKTNRAQHNLSHTTFGNRVGEVILAKNLIQYGDRKTINKVGRIIHRYRRLLKLVKAIEDTSAKNELVKMLKNKYWKKADSVGADPSIDTFTKNVINIYYREALNG